MSEQSTVGSDKHRPGTLLFLGVPIDDVDMDETLEAIWSFVPRGRQQGRGFQVATVNVDFVVNALRDRSVARILRSAALSIPDGMPLVWTARFIGGSLRTRVAGADLVPLMCRRAAVDGTRIALIGAAPGVAEEAAAAMRERHPGLDVVATEGPMFRDLDDITDDDIEALRALHADIGCFAFGHPKQDAFIERFGDDLAIPVMIGVGGSLDFLIGVQQRAPRWMQQLGLEWLHRAATDPRRLAMRYVRDFRIFFPALARQAWAGRSRGSSSVPVDSTTVDDETIIDLAKICEVDNSAAHEIVSALRRAAHDDRVVRFTGVDQVDLDRTIGLRELIETHPASADALLGPTCQ